MKSPYRHLPGSFLLLMLITGWYASTATASDRNLLNVEFRTFLWYTPSLPSGSVLGYGNDLAHVTPIQVYPGRLSPPFSYRGPAPLNFFLQSRAADKWQLIARPTLSPESSQVLFLIMPPTKANGNFDIRPIAIGPQELPSGKAMVINLTDEPLAFQLDKQQILLQAEESKLLSCANSTNRILQTQLASRDKENKWVPHRLPDIVIDSPNDALLILLYSPGPGQYRVLTINPNS